jgi:hypothetical protein
MGWLYDADGDPIDVPASCAGFRIRHWPPGARGIGTIVRDQVTGAPLVVPSSATPDQFRDLVGDRPGRYVLTLVDQVGRPLRRAPEGIVVLGNALEAATVAPNALTQILERIDALERATLQALAQLTASVEQLRAMVDPRRAASAMPPVPAPRPAPPQSAPIARTKPAPAPAPRAAPRAPSAPPSSPAEILANMRAVLDEHMAIKAQAEKCVAEVARATPGSIAAMFAEATGIVDAPTPPLTDEEVREYLEDVARQLPPFPQWAFRNSIMRTDITTQRDAVAEARQGKLDIVEQFKSREVAEMMLAPAAKQTGGLMSLEQMLELWLAPELPFERPSLDELTLPPAAPPDPSR